MNRSWLKWAGVIIVWCWAGWAQADALVLTQYLDEVQKQNPSWSAAKANADACRAKLKERDLLTSIYLTADSQLVEDKSQSLQPLFYGDSRSQDQWSVGLEEQTGFGLSWKLLHQTIVNGEVGADPAFVLWDKYYTSRTGLEISQDLWRNVFGKEVMATANNMEAQTQAQLLVNEYQAQMILVEAEKTYWKLSVAREVVGIHKVLLDRVQDLTNWVENQVELKHKDKSDLLQAQSQLQSRQLELATAREQENLISRGFNLLRRDTLAAVDDELVPPGNAEITVPEPATNAPKRKDVAALEFSQRAAAEDETRKQMSLAPELKASAGYYFNGVDNDFSQAFADAEKPEHASYTVGLAIRLPLDYFSRQELQLGYHYDKQAMGLLYQQRALEAASEWQEIRRQLQDISARWQIAVNLEELQKRKTDYERTRLSQGNSTTYQALQFELDWGRSELARVDIEATILELKTNIKLYE
jgi:outer membrane protein TolC